jgi:hypothetical protein
MYSSIPAFANKYLTTFDHTTFHHMERSNVESALVNSLDKWLNQSRGGTPMKPDCPWP